MTSIKAILVLIFITGSGDVELIPYKTYDSLGKCIYARLELNEKYKSVLSDCILVRGGSERAARATGATQ